MKTNIMWGKGGVGAKGGEISIPGLDLAIDTSAAAYNVSYTRQ